LPTRVKIEPDSTQLQIIKQEANAFINLSNDFHSASQVRTRTVVENGTETIEILSDTEDEPMGDDDGLDLDWDMHASSDTLIADPESISSDDDLSDGEDAVSSDFESSEEPELDVSTTQWLDPEIKSQVSNQPRRLNRQLLVERVEYLSEIPTYWPVPHQKTAYILDLRDPKFDVVHDKGELLSVDALIKNKVCPNTAVSPSSVYISLLFSQDQDSWTGGTGGGDSKPSFDIFTGESIPCRRSRLECAGFHACSHVNPKLLNVKRYELDPKSLDEVVQAQVETRITEADSAEKLALMYVLRLI
jgi:hypothetical protein